MKNIRKIFMIWKYQTITNFFEVKLLTTLIMIFVYIQAYEEPYCNFLKAMSISSKPYLFAIFMNDPIFPIIILLGYILIICDAPFITNGYLFLVARSGKVCWIIGEVVYMLTNAVTYTLVVFLMTIINILPHIEFGTDWGKAILTIARTDATQYFDIQEFNQVVVEKYTAIEATVKTLILLIMLLWLLGMLI